MSKRYYDIELGREVTIEELNRDFQELAAVGNTDCTTLSEYIHAAVYYSGVLEPIED